jgi:hypothetical protein
MPRKERPRIVGIDLRTFDWGKHNRETVEAVAKLNGWREIDPQRYGQIAQLLGTYNHLYVRLTEAGYEPAFVAKEIWERGINEWDRDERRYIPGTDPHFQQRMNPERVTFGKQEQSEPGTSEGYVYLDGKDAGEILGHYHDFSTGMAVDYRVIGYSATVWHPDDDDLVHELTEDVRGVTTRWPDGGTSGAPGEARKALSRLRKRIRDTLDPKFHRLGKGQYGPRRAKPRKNPTRAETLLKAARGPCMTAEEAHHAARSIERSLRAIDRHSTVSPAHKRGILKLLGSARKAKTPRGRVASIFRANTMVQQLRARGAGSKRVSAGYRPRRGSAKDPRLGHLFTGPALSEAALARRRAYEAETEIAANPSYYQYADAHALSRRREAERTRRDPGYRIRKMWGEYTMTQDPQLLARIQHACQRSGWTYDGCESVPRKNPYPHVEEGWKRAAATALQTWAWQTLEVLGQATNPSSPLLEHQVLRGDRPMVRVTRSFWVSVIRRAAEGPLSDSAVNRSFVRWKKRCFDYGLERFDGYDHHHPKQQGAVGWYAFDLLGAHDAVWAILGVPHPLEADLVNYGGATKGEARERFLLDRSRNQTPNVKVWERELSDHESFYADPSWFVPEERHRKGALGESREVRHYATYHPGGGQDLVAAQKTAKGRYEAKTKRRR